MSTMQLIQEVSVSTNTFTFTFNEIPQNFDDLVIAVSSKDYAGISGLFGALSIRPNGSSTNYALKKLSSQGSSVYSYTESAFGTFQIGYTSGSDATADTFGSTEIYIPNYAGTHYKTISASSSGESQTGTGIYYDVTSGIWYSQEPITSVTIYGYFAINTYLGIYGIKHADTSPGTFGIQATGGDVTISGGYKYHVFKSSGTFTVTEPGFAEVLMVAGGGAGGAYNGSAGCGGGGAGGVQLINTLLNKGPLVVGVGAGGTGSTGSANGSGSNTFVANLSQSIGGGFGSSGTIGFGGSSGGADGGAGIFATSAVAGQGNKGGDSPALNSGGGGGGAGGVGGNGSSSGGGAGGVGTSAYSSWGAVTNTGHNVSGTRFFAGGGGGSWGNNNSSGNGLGGNGGGGNANKPSTAGSGMANTGGGGGASSTLGIGGSGGSGIVIIRYPVS